MPWYVRIDVVYPSGGVIKSVYDPAGIFGRETASSVPVCSPPWFGVSNCHDPNTFTSDELFCSMESVPNPDTDETDDVEETTDSDDDEEEEFEDAS